jgi:soluble lytic murein transglycosylase-like protein
MAMLERVTHSLSGEEWRYVGAGSLAFAGLVALAFGVRIMRSWPPSRRGSACPVSVYEEVIVGKHGGKARVAKAAWEYEPIIVAAADHFGVPPDLMMGMAHTESRFQPTAVSSAGAVGLVQIIPATATSLRKQLMDRGEWPFQELDRADPEQSAWMAAWHIADMIHREGRTLENAVATYFSGGVNVKPSTPQEEWSKNTRSYVRAVLRRAAYYREIWQICGTIFA